MPTKRSSAAKNAAKTRKLKSASKKPAKTKKRRVAARKAVATQKQQAASPVVPPAVAETPDIIMD